MKDTKICFYSAICSTDPKNYHDSNVDPNNIISRFFTKAEADKKAKEAAVVARAEEEKAAAKTKVYEEFKAANPGMTDDQINADATFDTSVRDAQNQREIEAVEETINDAALFRNS